MNKRSSAIYLIICSGIVLNIIFAIYAQQNLEKTITEETYGWYYQIGFIGNVLISFASIISFLKYHKYFPKYITLIYITLLLIIIVAWSNNYLDILQKPSLLYSTKGIGTWLNFGILYFAFDKHNLKNIFKLFYLTSLILLTVAAIKLISIGILSDRNSSLYAIRDLTVSAVWVFPFFFLKDENGHLQKTINYLFFIILFLCVLAIASRSYVISLIFIFCFKINKELKNKSKRLLFSIGSLLFFLVGYIMLVNSDFYLTYESILNLFTDRINDDSRTSQLSEFLNQYDLNFLFSGVGPFKTWNWSGSKTEYQFLDNQFLLISWWAGLPAAIIYFYFLISTLFKRNTFFNTEIKIGKVLIGLWILACAGFAIYVTVSSSIYYYFLTLLIGLITQNKNNIHDPIKA